jgi:hypothetical protein
MGGCFDCRVYRKMYFKEKTCPVCKSRTRINDGRRTCTSEGCVSKKCKTVACRIKDHECHWSERAVRSKLTKEQCESKWDLDVNESQYCDGHQYSGAIGMLDGKINWISSVFSTEEKAIEYIEKNHNKWDNPMGVKFDKARGSSNRLTKQLGGFIIGGWCSS